MPAFETISSTTWTTRTNTTITAPTGITDGDELLLIFATGAAAAEAPDPTPPSGFDPPADGTWPIELLEYDFNLELRVYRKIADSESGDYTVTHSSCESQGVIVRISDPGDWSPALTQNQGTNTTTTATGLTAAANSLNVFINVDYIQTGSGMSPPSGSTPTYTERFDSSSAPIYVATGEFAAGGATGNETTTNRGTESISPWAAVLISIEPAGGATEHNATVAVVFGGLTVAGAATVTKIATSAVTFGGLTVAAVARSASVTITFGGLTVAGAATVTHPASAAVAFGGLGVAAAGTVTPASGTHNATVSVAFGGLSISSSATKTVFAVVPVTFGALSIGTAATRTTSAPSAVSFGALSMTVSATKTVLASSAVTLGGLTVTAAGVIPSEVEAISTVVFGGLTVAAVATTETPGAVTATVSVVFGRLFITARVPDPGPTYLAVITERRRNFAHNVTGRTKLQTRTS
jgi:hypothetical protein